MRLRTVIATGGLRLMAASALVFLFAGPDRAGAQYREAPERGTSFYVGAYGGLAFPEKLQGVSGGTGFDGPTRMLSGSGIYGIKVGFAPSPRITWVGWEAEAFYTGARLKGTSTGDYSSLGIRAIAFNFILRYPGSWFQPYIGVGPSSLTASSYQAGGTSTAVGLNAVAGIRVPVFKRFMLFGEYKHNRTTFEFTSANFDYRLHAVVGGIAWTFEP